MNKNRFYIIYNYDAKELPYMLCDTIKDVAQAIGYSERMVKHGLNKGYVFTTQGNKRYTVQAWNMDELKGV